ncbi:uncharacterized protein PITG_08934 [Phytophthora infestans T30-4]|uniref:Transmembrane protein n=1 Tax=Phytophthora infestans (strain T30-4) TaxID=403677 RepID=D0NDJ2_PHYIT|nr:uncharacterized protein PITG_08934 [Phytophthora infestans T30-4]EEY56149.1 hypothetical protein PITG_08934 [Phytophthora infestans T30-4]|eukprot:XP_002902979.1 hypothetical protein PITG_08934 [Phytophthora infestans T30-4]
MIIRAVSDSDSEEELLSAAQAASSPRRSVFDPPDVTHSSTKGNAARYSWFVACGTLVLLLLVDLAAVFDPSPDAFALLPLLIPALFYHETIILYPTASILNQFVGLALVGVWIYTREKGFAAGSSAQWLRNARYGPLIVGALLCLGHVVSCLYLLFALLESNGDHTKFWIGRQHSRHSTSPYGRV